MTGRCFYLSVQFILLSTLATPKSSLADSDCKVAVKGPISNRTWYDLETSCKKIGTTADLLSTLKIDAIESEYMNCEITESVDYGTHVLLRGCDEPRSFVAFASPISKCVELLKALKK